VSSLSHWGSSVRLEFKSNSINAAQLNGAEVHRGVPVLIFLQANHFARQGALMVKLGTEIIESDAKSP
jgi:hypothetical protein